MEEQEKIDMREHLIGWIDTFLKDGIIPSVVNPKAIKANYILKSKIRDKIEELETKKKKYGFGSIESIIFLNKVQVLKELLEEEKCQF